MSQSTRLAALRLTLDWLYWREAGSDASGTPPLHALFPVPISERLVLLALLHTVNPCLRKLFLHLYLRVPFGPTCPRPN